MVLSFLLIVFIGRVQSTWESILTPDGWDDVFIPSTVHIELTTCLGNLHELMLVNKQLNTRIERLEATILQMQNTSHPPRPLIASPTSHTTSDTVHPITQPTKKQQTSQPTKQPTMRPTKPPTAQPTKQPTHAPTNKPTKFPTFKPTKRPIIPKPTQSPTHHPTIKPTDAWDRPAHVVTLPKAGKNGRQKPPKNSEEQGFDALIQSANANRGIEQNCIIFYDCADVQMMHQLERDLITREYGNELIIVRDWDHHGLSKDKSMIYIHPHKFQKVKEYYTDAHYLAGHLIRFEDCFEPSVTTVGYTYDVHRIKKWMQTVICSIAASVNSTKALFDSIYHGVSERHSQSNVSHVHALLKFMDDTFDMALHILKQKHKPRRMNKALMGQPDVDPHIFHSSSVMLVVLDFYTDAWLCVLNMMRTMVTDSFNSWGTHSFVVNGTLNQEIENCRKNVNAKLLSALYNLGIWLRSAATDQILESPSNEAIDELLEFAPYAQAWRDSGNLIQIAQLVYDWKRIAQLHSINIHIPRPSMSDDEWEFMEKLLQELRYTIGTHDFKIKRFNVTYLKRSSGGNKGKTRNKSPDNTMTLFNKYTLNEMNVTMQNETIPSQNQGNIGDDMVTIATYETDNQDVIEKLEQDLVRKCPNELVIVTHSNFAIDNGTSTLHIGSQTFTRVIKRQDGTDYAFYHFFDAWLDHFMHLSKTPVTPQKLEKPIVWLKQVFYSTATQMYGMATSYRTVYSALTMKYANATSKQQDMLDFIQDALEEGSRFVSVLEAGGEDPQTQITEVSINYRNGVDISALEVFFDYYLWSWCTIIGMQRNAMIYKFNALESRVKEDAVLMTGKLQIAVELLKDLVLKRNITSGTLLAFAKANRMFLQFVEQWQILKLSVDIANIVGAWQSSRQLRHYNIHIPRYGILTTNQWQFFWKLLFTAVSNSTGVESMQIGSGIEISRYKVRLLTTQQQRQIKSKKKEQQRHINTLLDTYHLLSTDVAV
eukprot:706704_1